MIYECLCVFFLGANKQETLPTRQSLCFLEHFAHSIITFSKTARAIFFIQSFETFKWSPEITFFFPPACADH